MASSETPTLLSMYGVNARDCWYCHRSQTLFEMWPKKISVQAFQELVNRGWARFGYYIRTLEMKTACCPEYTPRCDVTQFRPSRSQKRIIRRLNAFLNDGVISKRPEIFDAESNENEILTINSDNKNTELMELEVTGQKLAPTIEKRPRLFRLSEKLVHVAKKAMTCLEATFKRKVTGSNLSLKTKDTESNLSASMKAESRRQPKAKLQRRQRKLEKLRAKGYTIDVLPPRPPPPSKKLEDLLSFAPSSTAECIVIEGAKHKLEIRLVPCSMDNEDFANTFEQSCDLFRKYRRSIHGSDDYFDRSWLCSPLEIEPVMNETHHPGYGSFHQQYWLDGEELIAVGVLDILPTGISSMYFYHDPQYRVLLLGVYSALQEIALVRRLQQLTPDLRYYYIGAYVHASPKMKYKEQFRPTELLCPEAYTWHPIATCQKKLDSTAYCRFDEIERVDPTGNVEIEDIRIAIGDEVMSYADYKTARCSEKMADINEEEIIEFARQLGRKVLSSFIYHRKTFQFM